MTVMVQIIRSDELLSLIVIVQVRQILIAGRDLGDLTSAVIFNHMAKLIPDGAKC